MDEQAGIEIAGARAHNDAACRRQAHRSVDGVTVGNGGDAGAVSQMSDDQARRDIFAERVQDRFV